MEKRKYIFGELEIMVDASIPPDKVRESWSSLYPQLQHAKVVDRGNEIEFVEAPGEKG